MTPSPSDGPKYDLWASEIMHSMEKYRDAVRYSISKGTILLVVIVFIYVIVVYRGYSPENEIWLYISIPIFLYLAVLGYSRSENLKLLPELDHKIIECKVLISYDMERELCIKYRGYLSISDLLILLEAEGINQG